jgi:hypothetical protein
MPEPATILVTPEFATVNAADGPDVVTAESEMPVPAVGVTDVTIALPPIVAPVVIVRLLNVGLAVVEISCGSEMIPGAMTSMNEPTLITPHLEVLAEGERYAMIVPLLLLLLGELERLLTKR